MYKKTQSNVGNKFKVNNKDTRKRHSTVDFEQVNDGWRDKRD